MTYQEALVEKHALTHADVLTSKRSLVNALAEACAEVETGRAELASLRALVVKKDQLLQEMPCACVLDQQRICGRCIALALTPADLADCVVVKRDEIDRWRDSNNRLRDEMEHQAREAIDLRTKLAASEAALADCRHSNGLLFDAKRALELDVVKSLKREYVMRETLRHVMQRWPEAKEFINAAMEMADQREAKPE